MGEYRFYIQNMKVKNGDAAVWHGKDGTPYVTDLKHAKLFDLESAIEINKKDHNNVPWPEEMIKKIKSNYVNLNNL